MDPLQFGDGRRDELDFFAAERSGLARVWIQSRDGDAPGTATPDEKIAGGATRLAQSLGRPQVFGHAAEGDVGGYESDSETRSGQEHGEVLHAAACGEKLGLAGKRESDFIRASLVNRSGHNRIDLMRDRKSDGFLERAPGLRAHHREWAGLTSARSDLPSRR